MFIYNGGVFMSKLEQVAKNEVKLTIEITPEIFKDGMDKAYHKVVKTLNVPGFRKGKAPKNVIEKMYGESIFYDDAFEATYFEAYIAAVEEHKIIPVEAPHIEEIVEIGSEKGVVFTARVTTKPEVVLGQYKGIEVEKHEYNVTDEDISYMIDQMREERARLISVDRAVENGDTVTIDYSGSVDGVKFDGGTAENQELVIGSGRFIPGFEEQLIGMNKEEEKDITVTFPQQYHSEKLAGKEAVFHIKLHDVHVKELPELDDEFVQDVSEFNTVEELKNAKRAELEEIAKRNEQARLENKVLEKVANNAEVEIPHVMIHQEMDRMIGDLKQNLAMQGLKFEDYLKYAGTTEEAMLASYHEPAEQSIKSQLVLDAIIKAENIEATDEEVEKAIADYAKNYGMEAEQLKGMLRAEDFDYFKSRAEIEKALKFLADNAVLVEKKEEKEEKKDEE